MKNIHLIPTDKPSNGYMLGKCIKELADVKEGQFAKTHYLMFSEEYFQPHHIYITSDEKFVIDEYITDGIEMIKATPKLVDGQGLLNRRDWMKVILSSDLDLDGVQAIDDEFLEWFVKNPSCEYVEVSEDYFKPSNMVYGHDTEPYKIIIPKEEQKQHLIDMMKSDEELGLYDEPKTKCYCGHTTYCDCGPEQELDMLEAPMPIYKETLEEAAEEYGISVGCDNGTAGVDFMAGAKYQQEQDKKMYSELVDLLERLATIYIDDCDLDIKYDKKRLEFIEQLKKK